MSECLLQFIGLASMDALTRSLILTSPPSDLPESFHLLLSGGVSEYFFGRSDHDAGDLGRGLAGSLHARLSRDVGLDRVIAPVAGIRATVIGVGQFSLQLTGDTVFVDGRLDPPLRAVPVHRVDVDWDDLSAPGVGRVISAALGSDHSDGPFALAFPTPKSHGYVAARRLARALAACLPAMYPSAGFVLSFEQNLARTVGAELARTSDVKFLCVDELQLPEMCYLDIGAAIGEATFLPVVVKDLVFAA
jgi:ethanolamine utilization protein EutA